VLVVFLKAPRPGAVKTRLAVAVGAEAAVGLYRVLAEQVMRATEPQGAYRRLVFFDPPHAVDEVRAWLGDEALIPQEEGDLGRRMAGAFAEAFRRGASRAAIIGTDAPAVSRALVVEALEGLDGHDVVVGPARDGGYYLLALSRPQPALFEGIPWSTPSVLQATLARASALGLRVRQLEAAADVDTLEDVHREWDRLRPLLTGALVEALRPERGPE
jgi:uncharacterized protein